MVSAVIRRTFASYQCALMLLICGAHANVLAEMPAVKLITAPQIAPGSGTGQAWAYYNGFSQNHTSGVTAWTAGTRPPEIKELARALGKDRYIQKDYADNVYEYIRSNVATEFRFGLSKGARGAVIDQSGTAFDQVHLMVELLREAGISASYQVGTFALSAADFGKWSGLVTNLNQSNQTFCVNAAAALQFLTDGGIPVTISSGAPCGSDANSVPQTGKPIVMGHVWLTAVLDGQTWAYDPSFKVHALKSRAIDFVSTMQCGSYASATCGTTIANLVPSPANIAGSNNGPGTGNVANSNVSSTSEATINSQLGTYATNLATWVRNYNRDNRTVLSVEELVGGKTVDQGAPILSGAGSSLADHSAQYTWSGDIPDSFRTRLTVGVDNISQPLYVDEIYGGRLAIWESPWVTGTTTSYTRRVGLYWDYKLLASSTVSNVTAGTAQLVLAVNHPYAAISGSYADSSYTMPLTTLDANLCGSSLMLVLCGASTVWVSSPVYIAHTWGDGAPSVTSHFTALAERDVAATTVSNPLGLTYDWFGKEHNPNYPSNQIGPTICKPTSTPPSGTTTGGRGCHGEHLPIMIANWFAQISRSNAITGDLVQGNSQHHHSLGFAVSGPTVADETLFNVQSSMSAISRSGTANDRKAAFFAVASNMSRLEGSILEQSFKATDGLSAVSTLVRTNNQSSPTLEITSANYATALANLSNYSTSQKADIQARALAGFTVLAPKNAKFTVAGGGGVNGASMTLSNPGYLAYNANGDLVSYVAPFGLKGAAASSPTPEKDAIATTKVSESSLKASDVASIALKDASFRLEPSADLRTGIGEFPYSLEFRRSYGSNESLGGVDPKFCSATALSVENYPCHIESIALGARAQILGGGWTHNWDIKAAIASDGLAGMGIRGSALESIRAIVGTYVTYDAARTISIRSRLAAVYATHWWQKNLQFNVVEVKRGAKKSTFVRGLDGTSFTSEPGAQEELVQTAGAIALNPAWNNRNIQLELRGAQGDILKFAEQQMSMGLLWRDFYPQTWQFPTGVKLTFTYATDPYVTQCLTAVTNNLNRKIEFENTCATSATHNLSWVRDENGRTTYFRSASQAYNGTVNYTDNRAGIWSPSRFIVTNAEGGVTTYEYVTHPTSAIHRPYTRIARWFTPSDVSVPFYTVEFDSLYRVKSATDKGENKTEYFSTGLYGPENQKRGEAWGPQVFDSVSRAQRRPLSTEYFNRFDLPELILDPLGRGTFSVYDGARHLIRKTDPEGAATVFTYDARHNVLTETSKPKPGSGLADLTTSMEYMEGSSVTSCANRSTCNKVYRTIDARGNSTTYGWHATYGTLTSITGPPITTPNGTETPYTEIAYVAHSAVAGSPNVALPVSKTERIRQLPSVVTVVTSYAYKPIGLKLALESATVDASGINSKTTFSFDAAGNIQSIDGPRTDVADITGYVFDAMRRLTRINAPLSSITRHTYDSDGRLKTTRRAVVASPTDSNPANPRPTDLVAAHWQTVQRDYWPDGSLKTVTDPEGYTSTSTYDSAGRLEYLEQEVAAGVNRVTRFVYDLAGQKAEEYRGWGTTDQIRYGRWGYTPNGKVDFVDDPVASTSGSLSSAASARTEYVYDGHDRLWRTVLPHPTTGNPNSACDYNLVACTPVDFEQYGYDENGNPKTKRNRSGITVSMTYNALNQETQRVVPDNPAVPGNYARTLDSRYDLLGRLIIQSADGQSITTTWDKAGRMDFVTDIYGSNTYIVDYTFDAAGNRIGMTWPGGGGLTYTYDALNRMDTVVDSGGVTLANYDYDQLSRRDYVTFGNGTYMDPSYYADDAMEGLILGGGGRSATFGYTRNRANQITGLNVTASTSGNWSEATFLQRPASGSTLPYQPDKLNRYGSVNGMGYSYDLNGNLASDGVYTFTYDEENRLRTASGAGNEVTYIYDPAGRRRAKTVTGPYAGTTIYLSDGVEEIEERDGSNNMLRRYAYGPNIDDRIAMLDTALCASRCFYQTNHQSSTVALSKQDGSLVDAYGYDAYGRSTVPATGNQFRYTGRRYDPETALYYYRARYYSSNIGRFLQTDPIGTKDDLNLYAYVGNDPGNRNDPNGLCGTRYSDGTCEVKIDPKTGGAGKTAGKELEARLNAFDRSVNATPDKAAIAILDTGGKAIGTISGSEFKAVWNGTSFSITSEGFDNGGAGGGTNGTWSGDSFTGYSKLNPVAVVAYGENARGRNQQASVGIDTLIFHELGHNTHFGKELIRKHPVTPEISWPREWGTSSAGKAMADSVGAGFNCSIPGGCQ